MELVWTCHGQFRSSHAHFPPGAVGNKSEGPQQQEPLEPDAENVSTAPPINGTKLVKTGRSPLPCTKVRCSLSLSLSPIKQHILYIVVGTNAAGGFQPGDLFTAHNRPRCSTGAADCGGRATDRPLLQKATRKSNDGSFDAPQGRTEPKANSNSSSFRMHLSKGEFFRLEAE